jgi:hypothetical protein
MLPLGGSGGILRRKRVPIWLGKLGITFASLKSFGGLGFRSSKKFNDALLAKITWMVLSKRDSMLFECSEE